MGINPYLKRNKKTIFLVEAQRVCAFVKVWLCLRRCGPGTKSLPADIFPQPRILHLPGTFAVPCLQAREEGIG
jgi:hypothetical protein